MFVQLEFPFMEKIKLQYKLRRALSKFSINERKAICYSVLAYMEKEKTSCQNFLKSGLKA